MEQLFTRALARSNEQFPGQTREDEPSSYLAAHLFHSTNAFIALRLFLLSCPSLSVCSPSGVVLRVGSQILATSREAGMPSRAERFFAHISNYTWTVEVSEWPERSREPISGISLIAEALARPQREYARVLLAFNGWSITVHQSDVAQDDETIFDAYFPTSTSSALSDEASPDGAQPGRPLKLIKAMRVFYEKFPGGRETASREEIRKTIEGELGESFSETSASRLFRAIILLGELESKFGDEIRSANADQIAALLREEFGIQPGDERIGHVWRGIEAGFPPRT
ncbi:hypothetical protein [Maritimibacter sp. UBA3975]|uniref:hypothetical protein n=1 Tax=Maritimibacter sp. UBA3975 TaxID=1946833 RepID=UPI0025BB08BB|nr:hypothetical protein [Maritimibacter sp. UBA3975]